MSKADLHRLVDALPEDVIHRIEAGAPVTFVVTRDQGAVALREIDPEQAWFWTPEWQEGEREADAEFAAGQGTIYHSAEVFLAALEADLKPLE
jgi:hypothetical protein